MLKTVAARPVSQRRRTTPRTIHLAPSSSSSGVGVKCQHGLSFHQFNNDTYNYKQKDSPLNQFNPVLMSFVQIAPLCQPVSSMTASFHIGMYSREFRLLRS